MGAGLEFDVKTIGDPVWICMSKTCGSAAIEREDGQCAGCGENLSERWADELPCLAQTSAPVTGVGSKQWARAQAKISRLSRERDVLTRAYERLERRRNEEELAILCARRNSTRCHRGGIEWGQIRASGDAAGDSARGEAVNWGIVGLGQSPVCDPCPSPEGVEIVADHKRGDLHAALTTLVTDHGLEEVDAMLLVVKDDLEGAVFGEVFAYEGDRRARQGAGKPQARADAVPHRDG